MTELLNHPTFIVDQPKRYMTASQYTITAEDGTVLATGGEEELGSARKVGRVLSSIVDYPGREQRSVVIRSADEAALFSVDKETNRYRIAGLTSTALTVIRDAAGDVLGVFAQDTTIGKKHFQILDADGAKLATLDGNLTSADFSVQDDAGTELVTINNTANMARRLTTNSDRYEVTILQQHPDPLRTLLVAAVLVVDVVLRSGVSRV